MRSARTASGLAANARSNAFLYSVEFHSCSRYLFGITLFAALCLVAAPVWSAGLVGYWAFGEGTGTTTSDSSGNANTGTLTNSPTWSTGKIGNGLSFNGGTAQVQVGSRTSLTDLYLGGMTVSAWIKPAGSGGGGAGRIVDKDNSSGGWLFEMYGATFVKFAPDQFATTQPYRVSSSTIALNTWQLVTATWDGSINGANIHIYINGTLADGTSANGTGAAGTDSGTPFTIGNRSVDNARGFNGAIDEVRVYNRVLSAAEVAALADTQAPTAPSGLTSTVASSSQINLSWTASTDNTGVTGYLVERCQGASCSTFTQIATPTTTSYNNTGLTASTSYSYRVRATDAAGNLSLYSSTASVTTSGSGGDTTPPTVPSGLATTVVSASQINLTWTASTDNVGVTGYRLERCSGTNCTTFAQIATPTTTSYSNTGLAASTSYGYRVRATDAAGNLSGYSATAGATTPVAGDVQPPSNPTNLMGTVNATTITLTWNASSDNVGVTGYLVERCQGTGCTSFAEITTASTTSYTDSGLTSEVTYDYRVRATDAAGNLSGYSNTLGSTTQDCD